MKRILQTILITTFSVAIAGAECKAGAIDESRTNIIQPKVEKHRVKAPGWLRRIGAADVQFPIWLSSRGIPALKSEMEEAGQSYRFAVRFNDRAPQTLAEAER